MFLGCVGRSARSVRSVPQRILEPGAVWQTVDVEVAVDRQHLAASGLHRKLHHRRIGEVHRTVAIFVDQAGDGTDAALLELGQSKSTTVDPAQQAQLGIDTVAQQVHDFGQYRPGRHQRELVAAQKRHAALVVTIGRVEQGQ